MQPPAALDDDDDDEEQEDIPIDPVLLAQGDSLAKFIAGTGSETLPDSTQDAVWQYTLEPESAAELSIFHVRGTEFVRLLSSINVVRNDGLAGRGKTHRTLGVAQYGGNSRDPPTFWEFKCKNYGKGCTYSSVKISDVTLHDLKCVPKDPESIPVNCLQCPKSFATVTYLKKHVKSCHEAWVPRSCQVQSCVDTTVFATKKEWRSHSLKYHDPRSRSAFTARRCQYPGCVHEKEFTSHGALLEHLLRKHNVLAKDAHPYTGIAPPTRWVKKECPVPGCRNTRVFGKPSDLRKHLTHGLHRHLSKDEVEAYMNSPALDSAQQDAT